MTKRSLFLILAASLTFAAACTVEDDDPVDCEATPEDEACQVDCEATPDDPACTAVDCEATPDDPACAVDCEATPDDPSCAVDCEATPDDPACEEEGPKYRFVLIQDLTEGVSGEYPGTDLDAIGLIKGDSETYATAIEGAEIPVDGNSAADTNGALGAPDFDCADGAAIDPATFTALGGKDAGGYLIASFGTDAADVILENGDTIKVYEIGNACNARYDDDEFAVSVSTGNSLDSFTEQGALGMGSGQTEIEISGLE